MTKMKKKSLNIKKKKIKLTAPAPPEPQNSVSMSEAQQFWSTVSERLAKFTKLFAYDPVADFFKLGQRDSTVDPNSPPDALALVNHPCRGCPHLLLAYTNNPTHNVVETTPSSKPGMYSNANSMNCVASTIRPQPTADVYRSTLPSPLCSAQCDSHKNPNTGEISIKYKETWHRCPMYGITYVNDYIVSMQNKIAHLEDQIRLVYKRIESVQQETTNDGPI